MNEEIDKEYQNMCKDISIAITKLVDDKKKEYENKDIFKKFQDCVLTVLSSTVGSWIGSSVKEENIEMALLYSYEIIEKEMKEYKKYLVVKNIKREK